MWQCLLVFSIVFVGTSETRIGECFGLSGIRCQKTTDVKFI